MGYDNDFRKEFLENNPDKNIIIDKWLGDTYGCHRAKATWTINCSVKEVIDYVDGSTGNYGGRIENLKENENGTESGTVYVYFD